MMSEHNELTALSHCDTLPNQPWVLKHWITELPVSEAAGKPFILFGRFLARF